MIYDAPHLRRSHDKESFLDWNASFLDGWLTSPVIYAALEEVNQDQYMSSSEAVLEDNQWVFFDSEEVILTDRKGDIYLLKKWIEINNCHPLRQSSVILWLLPIYDPLRQTYVYVL